MHRAGPFFVASVDEGLAETGGGTEVDLQHGVTAVGQPLHEIGVAVGVAAPRPAVDQQHHRHRLGGAAVAIGIGLDGQGQVADQVLAVTRGDDHAVHLGQRVIVEHRVGDEQFCQFAGGGVENLVDGRAVALVRVDRPVAVVEGLRQDLRPTRQLAVQPLDDVHELDAQGAVHGADNVLRVGDGLV